MILAPHGMNVGSRYDIYGRAVLPWLMGSDRGRAQANSSQKSLELQSDGLFDSLTGALAPERFLEILASELRMASREHRQITLISIRLSEEQLTRQIDEQELLLTQLAGKIRDQLRAGDYCARISETGFWILIRGDGESARKAAPRLIGQSTDGLVNELLWRVEFCESESGENIKNLLRRMDAIHFTK